MDVRPLPRTSTLVVSTWLPLIVCAILLFVLVVTRNAINQASERANTLRFYKETSEIKNTIDVRLRFYMSALLSSQSFIVTEKSFSLQRFNQFVDGLNLQERFPGIQGLGFTQVVRPEEREVVEQAMRAAGHPSFRVFPEFERSVYHTIITLIPLDERNRRAIGFDMYTEPVRREAMERAANTGKPALSGAVTLVQETGEEKQPGFLIYLPVKFGVTASDPWTGPTDIAGFVYIPFRAHDLFRGIFGPSPLFDIDFSIFDGDVPRPETLLYEHRASEEDPKALTRTDTLEFAGRRWMISYRSQPAFSRVRDGTANWAFALGILSCLLIGLLLFLRSRQEFRRKQWEQALIEREARFRFMADNAPVLIWMRTLDGDATWFNKPWLDFTGRSLEEQLGVGWMQRVAHHDRGAIVRTMRHAFECREPFIMEYHLRRHDGEYRWILDHGVPMFDESGNPTGYIGSCIDITERKVTEEERSRLLSAERAARNQLELASRMKDEFLATISHEIRTPLNAILGWSQLLRRYKDSPEKLGHGLDVIETNARAQAQIIEDLLDMHRIISGKVRLDFDMVNLGDIVDRAIETVHPAAEAKGVLLTKAFDAPLEEFRGDPNRIQQILWNLLSNAVRHTPRGGSVEVRMSKTNDEALLEVSDTGEGIPPDFLPFIFDRFRQADSSTTRRHGGLGLGLSIAKQLVELHGGSISVDSLGTGKGTRFQIRLPRLPTRNAEDAEAEAHSLFKRKRPDSVFDATKTELDGMAVLAVDDEPDSLELVRLSLEERGAQVFTASTAKEALSLLESRRFDLLLSDIGMPEEDGYSLIAKIRSKPASQGGHIPAVALTAFARSEDRLRALNAGFHMHLPKPVEPRELVAVAASFGRMAQQPSP